MQESDPYRKEEDPIMFVMLEVIARLTDQVKGLEKLVLENPKTKKEIKEVSRELSKQINHHRFKRVKAVMLDADCQYKNRVEEVGTQTVFVENEANEEGRKRAIRICLDSGDSFEDLSKYLDMEWE